MSEKDVENDIKQLIHLLGGYCKKIHAGAMFKGYQRKDGEFKNYKVKLEDPGTNDLFAGFPKGWGIIEVKKDEKEVEEWAKFEDERSQSQHYEQVRAVECGGFGITTHSCASLLADLLELGMIELYQYQEFITNYQ